jgi:peptide/nickel transport system substrate-binding protein
MRRISLVAAALLLMSGAAEARTLRWAGASPILTLDPDSSSDVTTAGLVQNVYEALVGRDQNLDLVPGLAESWQATDPVTWRFKLRPGVTFAGGEAFTADDVKFSLERANPPQKGMYSQFLTSVAEIKVIDPLTVDVITKSPDPLLPRWLSAVAIMSKTWSAAHGALEATTPASAKDLYVVRNADGTGPFVVQSWDSSSGVVSLRRNPAWWGKVAPDAVTDVTFTPIASAPTRVAALLSGNVDLVTSLPVQDVARIEASPNLKVSMRPELRQMVVLMSPARDVPLDTWDKTGAPLKQNPWRDLRVREAVAHAINVPLIVGRVMQGYARASAIPSMPGLPDYEADLDVSPTYDPELSRRLLAEAGYPDGFRFRFRCTNDRYVNDEAICRAVASMLARVGLDAQASPEPWASFVKDLIGLNMDFILLAAAPNGQTTYDMLQGVWMTRKGPDGAFNWLRWSDPDFDADVEGLKTEFDPAKRRALMRAALTVAKDHVAGVFLHQQMILWGMSKSIDGIIRPDSYVVLNALTVHE